VANRYGYPDVVVTGASNSSFGNLRYSDAAYRSLAQDFQVASNRKLTYVKVSMKKNGTPTGNIWVKIYTAGATPTAGTLVATSDLVDVSTLSTGSVALSTVMLFYFSTPPDLTANTQYFMVFEGDFAFSTTNYVGLFRNTNTLYANGQGWVSNAGTWSSPGWDFQFSLYTNADGGAFDIDGADVTGITALQSIKGSAITETESVYISGGRNLTIQTGETLAIKQIIIGDNSQGAAAAGQRYGALTYQAGSQTTFTGDASAANSGIIMNPSSADTSSKDCRVTIVGTSAQQVVFTNRGNAYSASQLWSINNSWGTVTAKFYQFKWNCGALTAAIFSPLNINSDRTTAAECIIDDGYCIGNLAFADLSDASASTSGLIPLKIRRLTWDCETTGLANNIVCDVLYITYTCVIYRQSSFYFDLTDFKYAKTANTNGLSLYPIAFSNSNSDGSSFYLNRYVINHSNAIPNTVLIPTGLTATDTSIGQSVSLTISNIASYANTDFFEVAKADGTVVARFSKARYVAQGNVAYTTQILQNGIAVQLKVRATSDNLNYSEWSALSNEATPTAPAGGSGCECFTMPAGIKGVL
jgi:hypothetical protein